MNINLDGTWSLTYFASQGLTGSATPPADMPRVDAIVPGNVELDLERAGILPELFRGDNILRLRELESHEWWYEREFVTPDGIADRPVELVFHGVDCLATFWLNGERIGSSDNAFVEHTFDVGDLLVDGGPNTLSVRLESPLVAATSDEYEPLMHAQRTNWAHLWIRKPAHCYGWDIMPRALSAGLWRSVELVVRDDDEITDLYFSTVSTGTQRGDGRRSPARLRLFYRIATSPGLLWEAELRVRGRCGEATFRSTQRTFADAGSIEIEVPEPRLWWPQGYGEPNLYEVTVELTSGGRVLATRATTVGIRAVALDRTEVTTRDRPGQFLFRVNDVPIMVKGSNWVPADVFHSRDAERYESLLALFKDLGCNMVRCWGGNVYEDHAFFDICDRYGIMVWQDFAMACARYPQDESFVKRVRREATAVVRKLRSHPSLVIWCGDNECDNEWPDPSDNRLTREILPQVVMRHDPSRPYIASSPYRAAEVVETGDDTMLPEQHLWGPRDYYKSRGYTEHTAHFVGEIGYHGCPNVSSIKRFLDPEHLWPWQDNPQWITHASDPVGPEGRWAYRIRLMADQIGETFGEIPGSLEDFALGSQISQAEAKKFFVEMTRLGKWRRTGVLWWNVADGWPQFSDAVVDYYMGKKLAYHYLKRVQRPLCIMIDEPRNWHVRVVAGNDSRREFAGTFRVWDADSGETLLEGPFVAPANMNVDLGKIRVSHSDKRLFLIDWSYDENQGGNHYLLGFPPFSLEKYRRWLDQIARLPEGFPAKRVAQ